jgi:hypothetical protein
MIFGIRLKRKQKHIRESELQAWNNMAVWKDFKPPYISEAVWIKYIQHVTFTCFTWRSKSGAQNHHQRVHGSVTTHKDGSVLFVSHAKWVIRFFLITSIFFMCYVFVNLFNWQHFYLVGYDSWIWAMPDEAFCWSTCAEWWPPKRGATVHG